MRQITRVFVAIATKFFLTASMVLLLMASDKAYSEVKLFDHATTGFELEASHRMLACESCHLNGQFAGTPRNCVGCHNQNGALSTRAKAPNHIFSSDLCEACHISIAWEAVPIVDHAEVFGRCSQCHNNIVAAGQPPTHFPTGAQECFECHSDSAFLPASFVHGDNPGQCFSCHDGVQVRGRSASHINASFACEACHTSTNSFTPVVNVDHQHVIGACFGCHQDSQPSDHIAASSQCDACHGTYFFNPPFNVDHDHVLGTCIDCHNSSAGAPAPGRPVNHINVVPECQFCHLSRESFSPVTSVDHDYVIGECSSCHNGIVALGQETHPTGHMNTPPPLECDDCHFNFISFERGPL